MLAVGAACLIGFPADAFTNFIISGPGPGGGGRANTDYWVSCPDCTLFGYDSRNGRISRIGPFTGDSSPDFSYVVGSVNYDPIRRQITCICSKADTETDGAIYTVSARTGKTVHKLAWNRKSYGVGETMISAEPKSRLVLRTVVRSAK